MTERLTEVRGDDVGHVHLSVGRLAPHAALGRAGIGVPLAFAVIGDVVDDQGLAWCAHCETRTVKGPINMFTVEINLIMQLGLKIET